jgi:hypothetical protein
MPTIFAIAIAARMIPTASETDSLYSDARPEHSDASWMAPAKRSPQNGNVLNSFMMPRMGVIVTAGSMIRIATIPAPRSSAASRGPRAAHLRENAATSPQIGPALTLGSTMISDVIAIAVLMIPIATTRLKPFFIAPAMPSDAPWRGPVKWFRKAGLVAPPIMGARMDAIAAAVPPIRIAKTLQPPFWDVPQKPLLAIPTEPATSPLKDGLVRNRTTTQMMAAIVTAVHTIRIAVIPMRYS